MAQRDTRILLAVLLVVALLSVGIATAVSVELTQRAGSAGGTGAEAGTPPAVDAPSDGGYETLYQETIDSVATIRVSSASASGQGSGFLYDEQGHVVTNEHVVAGGESFAVQFGDGAWREAELVGADPHSDLAVLRVERVPSRAEPLEIAATEPRRGQPVAAMGSPYGLEGSISAGIVSGLNRSIPSGYGIPIPATIQTDAAINPGSSGGPLLALDGTVVGVNRATQGGGISYAISPLIVQRVVPALIANGSYATPYLGVESVSVTSATAEENDLDATRGVMVTAVEAGGPADGRLREASVETRDGQQVWVEGDVILAVDGTPVHSPEVLQRVIALETSPGDEVALTIVRDGRERSLSVVIGERPPP